MKQRSSSIKTRKADAASIIGDELADQLEDETQKTRDEATEAAQRALVVKAKNKPAETQTKQEPANAEPTQRAFLLPDGNVDFMAFGGATSLKEAQEFMKVQQLENQLLDQVDILWGVTRNIMRRPAENIEDRRTALSDLTKEFSEFSGAPEPKTGDPVKEDETQMSMVKQANTATPPVIPPVTPPAVPPVVEQTTAPPEQTPPAPVLETPQVIEAVSPVVGAISAFQQGVLETLSKVELSKDEKLKAIQPLLAEMAEGIQQAAEPPTTPQTAAVAELRSAIHAEFAPVAESLQMLVAQLSQGGNGGRRTHRSIPLGQNLSPESRDPKKPMSVQEIADRSVGLTPASGS